FQEAGAALQDRQAAILCRMAYAGDPRFLYGYPDQYIGAGTRPAWAAHPRSLCLRRFGRRLRSARHLPRFDLRSSGRMACSRAEVLDRSAIWLSRRIVIFGADLSLAPSGEFRPPFLARGINDEMVGQGAEIE